MAFTVNDFGDLVTLLEEHPEWRARLRSLVLTEELLQLPERFAEAQARTDAALASLAEAQQRTEASLTALIQRFDRLEGRWGNVEGGILEDRYERNLGNWLGEWLRKPQLISRHDLDPPARDVRELDDLDMLVRARSVDGEEVYGAVELSTTIRLEDVRRARERADALNAAGLNAIAVVGGYGVTGEARDEAEQRHVFVDLRRAPH